MSRLKHSAQWVIAFLLVAISPAGIAGAMEIEGVRFVPEQEAQGTVLRLQCVGLLRYKVLFKGYVAGLYLADPAGLEDPLADVPKRLELSYFWSIDGDDFGPAGETILERNFGRQALSALRPQLDQIGRLYEDVEPGDRYSLTYIPGVGTELALNGVRKGVIEGADFAAKYFAIWLGPKPLDASLRNQLVNCSQPS
jgi:hypothetical protein